MKKNLLITGGAGFVGSNLAVFLNGRFADYRVVCLDNMQRRGTQLNAARLKDHGIRLIKGDITNSKHLARLGRVDLIVDCAAEPSVLASRQEPFKAIQSNLIGTFNCLELARRSPADFIFLSTSRVYPVAALEEIPWEELPTRYDWKKDASGTGYSYEGITQQFPLNGVRSLYGATKLCSEHLIMEYLDMYKLRGVINRFGIIAGPWQWGKEDQGVVGFWVARHKYKGSLSYIGYGGTGKQVRDALHIDDVCELVLLEIGQMERVDRQLFNVGGGRKNSFSLYELTKQVSAITKVAMPLTAVAETRPHDLRIYIADNSLITKHTGWAPRRSLENILSETSRWIDGHFQKLAPFLSDFKKGA